MIVAVAVALGEVFVFSGVSKLATRPRWMAQSADLGVPVAVASTLPYFEVALGAALVAQLARRWLGAVAVLVLAAFTSLLVVRIAQGRRPPCACFGTLSANPIGWSHVARNGVLVALASVLVVFG